MTQQCLWEEIKNTSLQNLPIKACYYKSFYKSTRLSPKSHNVDSKILMLQHATESLKLLVRQHGWHYWGPLPA
jgi:hypothetical protein